MVRYFNEDEQDRVAQKRDTEITLGTGMLVAIPLGLLVLCGIVFGFGYLVGRRGTASTAATPSRPAVATPAPDQEPLQASASIPKPSAADQVPSAPAQNADAAQQASTGGTESSPAQSSSSSAPANSSPSAAISNATPVHPALGSSAPVASQPATTSGVHAALPAPAQTFMVQVAAVTHMEDANVLTNALRTRGYQVVERREPADGMIHVRIGPFSSREEANRWRDKLLGDGYNALVQP